MTDPGQEAAAGQEGAGAPPSEEALRAAYEQQVKQISVEQIVLENVITVLNLGMRRTGLSPGTEDERDPEQVRVAIESIRSQLPLLEGTVPPEHVRQIRDALSQLQMAYVRIGGGEGAPGSKQPDPGAGSGSGPSADRPPATGEAPASPPEAEAPAKPGEPGPAQRSGRLWVPGQ